MDSFDEHLAALKSAYTANAVPRSSGVFATTKEDLVLFYEGDGPACHRLVFTDITDGQLQNLAETCDTVTFRANQQDVSDENNRKLGKLDSECFAPKFNPETSGLMDTVRGLLLEGHPGKSIRVKLCRLNMYGTGSCFQPHKDMSSDDDMFGSLVVVYPTQHKGGSLRFQDGSLEYVLDIATAVTQAPSPSIAYIILNRDVEYEMMTIESGYRVTLTYNLYYVDAPKSSKSLTSDGCKYAVKAAFEAIIKDRDYLPEGGFIGFGLQHEYTLPTVKRSPEFQSLDRLKSSLKGSDALIRKACRDLGLKYSLKMVYYGSDDENVLVLCPGCLVPEDCLEKDEIWEGLHFWGGDLLTETEENTADVKVSWVSDMFPAGIKKTKTKIEILDDYCEISEGHHVYGHIVLIVDIPPVDERLPILSAPAPARTDAAPQHESTSEGTNSGGNGDGSEKAVQDHRSGLKPACSG